MNIIKKKKLFLVLRNSYLLNQFRFINSTQKLTTFSQKNVLLEDTYGRNHNYLRISLTERCNLRCGYCMPESGIELTPKKQLLSTSELLYLAKLFINQGVEKIRLTGGEPTVHKDLLHIVENLNNISGLKTIAITTNGLTLSKSLASLQKAGLNAINISLDTLNERKYEKITRRNGFSKVRAGIEYALALGYNPVKINCVVIKNLNEEEIFDFVELTRDKNIHVRFIEYMPFGGNDWNMNKIVSYADLLNQIREKFPDFQRAKAGFNETNKLYEIPGYVGRVGFISSITNNFCNSCNRLRLLADGSLKVCLLGSAEISLREALRNGCSDSDILALIKAAILRKKKQHAVSVIQKPIIGLLSNVQSFINCSYFRCYCSFSHITKEGKATMVDVSSKEKTIRTASASAEVHVGHKIASMIKNNEIKKGDALLVAKLAGISAAKQTSSLIPLCHNIYLTFIDVTLSVEGEYIIITSVVKSKGETGVEMEALSAVAISALTIYDMSKAISHKVTINNIRLLQKSGGKSNTDAVNKN